MNWLIISLIPPSIWAISNHIDKYLLNRLFREKTGDMVFMMLTSLAYLIILPIIYYFFPEMLMIGKVNIAILIGFGFLSFSSGLLYLIALREGQPSVVIPLFQITPVFSYFLGLFFLNEHLSGLQIIASLLILLGALFLVIEQEGRKFKIKSKVLFTMIILCMIHALFNLVFKKIALDGNYWGTSFWMYSGYVIFGLIAFISRKDLRDGFLKLFRWAKTPILLLTAFDEFTSIGASMIFNYAILIMPIAVVSVVANGLQPFFVLIFGIILTLLIPSLAHETLTKRHLGQKIAAILIIFLGSYLLNMK